MNPTKLFSTLSPYVGGIDALLCLDGSPHPDEPFDWSAVDASDVPFVMEVLARSDACCDALLDVEYRTIARRILARVAARDPTCLRRRPNADRCAAGLVWLAGQSSGEFSRRSWRRAQSVWDWFRVGSCSERGRTLRRAAGLEPDAEDSHFWFDDPPTVGDAALLHSEFRAWLIQRRDHLVKFAEENRKWSLETHGPTAHLRVRAVEAKPVVAVKGLFEGNRAKVIVGLGDDLDDADFFSLSVPDTHELVHQLQRALAAPLPRQKAS